MSQQDQTKFHAISKQNINSFSKRSTNGDQRAKHTCAYVHEGCPEQNAYKFFHNRNVSTRFLIDINRATTKPNQTIFFLKPNQIKRIARATISHQTKWGPKQNPNCSTRFNSWPDPRVAEQENIVKEEGVRPGTVGLLIGIECSRVRDSSWMYLTSFVTTLIGVVLAAVQGNYPIVL